MYWNKKNFWSLAKDKSWHGNQSVKEMQEFYLLFAFNTNCSKSAIWFAGSKDIFGKSQSGAARLFSLQFPVAGFRFSVFRHQATVARSFFAVNDTWRHAKGPLRLNHGKGQFGKGWKMEKAEQGLWQSTQRGQDLAEERRDVVREDNNNTIIIRKGFTESLLQSPD